MKRMHRGIPEFVLLSVVCILLFTRLGIGEFQSWDEALYVIRAKACLQFGAWLDQAPYAVGEMYSAAHPPLGVWVVAGSISIFGMNETAARLPSALAGLLLVFSLFHFLRKRTSNAAALIASWSLALSAPFLWYARHAQLDAVHLLFTGLATFAFVRIMERDRIRDVLLCGTFLGFSLLSKLLITCLALGGWIFVLILLKRWEKITPLSISLLIAIIVALPWYAYMMLTHPGYLEHVLSAVSIFAVEGYSHLAQRPWWYYFNQLLVGLPLLPMIILTVAAARKKHLLALLGAVWLVVSMTVLTVSSTKMPHFVLHVLLPSTFLIAIGTDVLRVSKSRVSVIVGFLVTVTISWSLSELIRISVRTGSLNVGAVPALLVVATLWVLFLAYLVITRFTQKKNLRNAKVVLFSALIVMTAASAWKQISRRNAVYVNGAHEIRETVNRRKIDRLYILHRPTPYSHYEPQLALYLDGWTLGWLPGKSARLMPWTSVDSLPALVRNDLETKTAIIWSRQWDDLAEKDPVDTKLIAHVEKVLGTMSTLQKKTRNYSLYTMDSPNIEPHNR